MIARAFEPSLQTLALDDTQSSRGDTELAPAFREERASVHCTRARTSEPDHQSEGLNLQVASNLVNYDLPWNPMRVEQRIGRIDQPASVVEVVNYTIPGAVEEDVYRALARRIGVFDGLVGELQPILRCRRELLQGHLPPAAQRARQGGQGPARRDRGSRQRARKGGVRFDEHAERTSEPAEPPAFDLEQLAHTVRDDLRSDLDQLPHTTTADPRHASRDAAGWRALATLGHPDLQQRIDNIAEEHPSEACRSPKPGTAPPPPVPIARLRSSSSGSMSSWTWTPRSQSTTPTTSPRKPPEQPQAGGSLAAQRCRGPTTPRGSPASRVSAA